MPSVFAGNQVHNGSFRADQLTLGFGGRSARGLLVQNINFTFGQAVSMLYEIGSEYVYYVGGRAQGTAGIGHILGPSKFGQQLVEKFRDLCSPHDIQFKANAGCGLTADGQPFRGGTAYTLQDAVLTNLGVTVTAEQVVINKMLSFMYIDLEYKGGTGPTGLESAVTGDTVQGGVVAPPTDAETATALNAGITTTGEELGDAPDPDDIPDSGNLGLGGTIADSGFTVDGFSDLGSNISLEDFLAGSAG